MFADENRCVWMVAGRDAAQLRGARRGKSVPYTPSATTSAILTSSGGQALSCRPSANVDTRRHPVEAPKMTPKTTRLLQTMHTRRVY